MDNELLLSGGRKNRLFRSYPKIGRIYKSAKYFIDIFSSRAFTITLYIFWNEVEEKKNKNDNQRKSPIKASAFGRDLRR